MLRRIILGIICLELIGASVFFGAVHTLVWSVLVFLSCMIFILYFLDRILSRKRTPVPKPVFISLFIFMLCIVWQFFFYHDFTLNTHPGLENSLSELDVRSNFPSLLSHYHSKLALYQWLIPIAAFITVPYILSSRRHLYILIGCVVAVAGLQGIYGIIQYLSPEDPFPFFARPEKQFHVGGTYICRNTYACLLAMGIPLALGLMLDFSLQGKKQISVKDKISYYLADNPNLPWIIVYFLCALSMGLGIFLSLSRGGILCFLTGICVFIFLSYRKLSSSKYSVWWSLMWCCILPLPLIVYFFIIGMDPLLIRFSDLPDNMGRLELWKASLDIFKNHIFWGTGGGSYPYALELYKSINIPSSYLYAHNDFLHFLVEYGIIGFLSLSGVVGLWWYSIIKNPTGGIFSPGVWCGILASICVVFSHAMVDFSLHIPGHRLLCATLMGSLFFVSASKNSFQENTS